MTRLYKRIIGFFYLINFYLLPILNAAKNAVGLLASNTIPSKRLVCGGFMNVAVARFGNCSFFILT